MRELGWGELLRYFLVFVAGVLFAWNSTLTFDIAIDRKQGNVVTESVLDEQLVCARMYTALGPCSCEVGVDGL